MKRLFIAHLAALAMLLSFGAGARATAILPDDVAWSYNFSPGAPAVLADGNPGAGVTFTNEPTKNAIGSSDVVASNLRVFSTALSNAPDLLTTNGAYSVALTLSTAVAGPVATTTLTFTGKLSGKFSADSANVSNMFGPNSSQTVQLGGYNFSVELIAYTPPGPPSQANAGSFAAHVTISAITPNSTTPEPSTILLSSLGLSLLGGAAWRKRRKTQAEVVA